MTFYKPHTFPSVLTGYENEIKIYNTTLSSSFCSSGIFTIDIICGWKFGPQIDGESSCISYVLEIYSFTLLLDCILELPSSGSGSNSGNTLFCVTRKLLWCQP